MSRKQQESRARRAARCWGKGSKRTGTSYGRRLSMEPLEERRLLAVLTVNTDKDYTSPGDGRVTLREAIIAANTDTATDLPGQRGDGVDTIVFIPGLDGDTINLAYGEIEITEGLTIDATSLTNNVTVNADWRSRIFNITASTGDFSFNGLTLVNGSTTGANAGGGAIRSLTMGEVALNRSTVSDSHTTGESASGGGIFALGDVTLSNSTISGNDTTGDFAPGGGVYSGGIVTLTDSTVSGNRTAGASSTGGGVHAYFGASLADSTLSGNYTLGTGAPGGGLYSGGPITTIENSTISGNHTVGDGSRGGGMYALGGARVTSATVSDNHTEGETAAGGGAWVGGNLTAREVQLIDNYTEGSGAHGGGFYAGLGLTFAEDSTASGNYTSGDFARGGALYGSDDLNPLTHAFVAITDSTLRDNHTAGSAAFGGAVFASATVTTDDSVLSENYTLGNLSRGGAIWSNGVVTINRSTVSDNYTTGDDSYGGGIHTLNDVRLTDSTLSGNHTEGLSAVGGGINAAIDVTITQSTVSGNYTQGAFADGGGVRANGVVVVLYSTVANNRADHASAYGGGLWVGVGPFFIIGSIVAKNEAGGGNPELWPSEGTLTVNHSLIGDKAGTSLTEAQTTDSDGNLIGDSGGAGVIDPLLDALADNGGPTETHALLVGSPAIDAGDPTLVAGQGDVSEFDQRGPDYYRAVNGGIGEWMDMGAFEYGNPGPTPIQVVPGDYNSDGSVDAADYSVWRNTVGSAIDLRADGSGPMPGVPDGVIDEYDYLFWKANFGSTQGGGGAASAAAMAPDEESDGQQEVAGPVEVQSLALTTGSAQADAQQPSALTVSAMGDAVLAPSAGAASAETVSPQLAVSELAARASFGRGLNEGVALRKSLVVRQQSRIAARQDDTLLAWLATQTGGRARSAVADISEIARGMAGEDANGDEPRAALDVVFNRLGSE